MDNNSKNQNDQNPTSSSGEIYSNQESSYAETLKDVPLEAPQQPFIGEQDVSGQTTEPATDSYGNQNTGYETSEGQGYTESPPFEENKARKYVIIILIALIILGLFFLVLKFLMNRKPKVPADAKITLTYWGLWEEEETMRGVIDEYQQKNPNITIIYLKQSPKQYREKLQVRIDKGEGPDIFRFHNTWTPMLINQLASVPKNIFSDEEYTTTFYPVVLSDLSRKGNYYGIPLEIDGLLLFYNDDILKSANVSVPKTWKNMLEASQSLTVKEKGKIITSGAALGTAENIEHFSDILGLMMLQNGSQLNSSFMSCSDPKKRDCASESLKYYRQFAEEPNNGWDGKMDNSIIAFSSAKTAMLIAPSYQAFTIQQLAVNNGINLNFKTAQVPQLPCPDGMTCPPINWATYWVEGVNVKSKNTDAAWKFLKYLSGKETMEKLYQDQVKIRKLFGEPYSRVDLGEKLAGNQYLAPLIIEAPTMKSFYLSSNTQEGETGINSRMINYLKNAVNSLSEGVSAESAIGMVDSGAKQVFQSFGINTSAQ
jgi:multiple sugar transport system substrate-binding protein